MTLFKRNSSRSDTHHVNLILFNQIRSFKFSMSFIIGMMLLVCGVGSVKGTAKKWNGGNSGNWNTDNHWSPNGVPGAADDVTIDISASISVDINPTINSLTINNPTVSLKSSGGTRTITINNTNNIITSGSSLTLIGSTGTRGGARPMNIAFTGTNNTMLIAGTLTLNASGGGSSYDATNSLTTVSGSIKNDGSAGGTDGTITSTAANLSFLSGGTYEHALDGGTIPTANWNAASTCLISGITNAVPTVESFAQSFGNFTWDCATQTSGISLIGNLSNINGNFTITNTNTGSLRLANGSVTGTLNVGGNFNQSAGTFYICGTTNSCTITMSVGGSFSLSNGTFNFSGSSGIGTVAVAGNFSNTSGTMTESGSGTGAVIFNGSTQQFYISGGTVSETINFTVNNGAILQMATSGTIVSGKGTFTVANGGTLGVTSQYGITQSETANPGNIAVTGIRTYNAGANYIYNGTTAQVTGNGLTGANNLIINNANGVTLSAPTSVSGFLNLTNGILTSNATNLLSITNTLNSGISGGSSTSFINGPVKWTLPINFSGTSYNFPTGNGTTYLPFTLNNLATGSGAISAQVQAFLGNSGGSVDGTLSSISTSEYWSLTTSGNFTNSSVSLSRPSAITPNDMIGGSVALAGPYTSLVGTPGTNTVSNSAIINNNRFFVFAQSKSITTGTITGSPFCAGSAVSIPYTIAGTYISGNVFTAQLSGPTGSFTTPVTIGTLTSTSAGTILGTIPAVTSTGTSYRIRVVSSTPSSVIGTNNGSDLIINSNTISAPATTGASGCIGTSSSLTAAGATSGYVYKWYDAPMGGNVIKTSTNNSDNTFPTPVLYSTTSYWVSIKDPSGCEGPRTQATATYPTICTDNQTAGANSWIGYIYSGFDTNFANNIYFGHYALAETFNENFGNGEDNYCFPITSNSTPISINTKNFSVRYLMNSNRKGLFAVDLGSDDGSRLTIDNTPIYNNWSDQTYSARSSVLINLTGSSSLIYDYYENAGQNQVAFQNLNQIIANNLTNNISQSIYTGISGTTISGDVFGTLPSGISLSGTGYQWTYSTSLSGTRIIIPGATGATYTPTATLAPFNTPGTYYLYRNAVLSSTNNVSPTTYMATNESNVAMLIVNTLSTANGIVTNSSCPLVADGGISLIKPVDNAVQFNYVTNDYIDLGSSLLNNLSAFTIEGWIKYKSSDFGTKTRIGLFGQNDAIELGIISSTDIQCYTSSNHSLDVTITATTLGDNKWHHIATVGNSTSITIYIDGVSKGSTPPFTSISSFGSSSDHASIGQVFDVAGKTNQTFPGQIRRVGFWNRSLSSAEITSLATTYTNFYTGSETGLIAGYNFTEGTGTTISSLFSSGGTVHTGSFVYSPNWADLLSYSWSNTSQTTRNISGLLMGTYTLTPTYGNSTTGTAEPFTVVSNNTCATNWKGTYSSVWNDKTNWTAQYVPAAGADVIFDDNAQKELDLDQNRTIGNLTNTSNQSLVIPPALCLTVEGSITTANASNIYIQSVQGKANGSFIIPNATNVQATVEMYSKALALTPGPPTKDYQWQYFGIPVHSVDANPTFYGSYVRSFNEGSTGGQSQKWTPLVNSSVLSSFTGYEITQKSPITIQFSGTLENSNHTFDLTNTSGVNDAGQNILSNSYTAALDIRQLTFGPNTEQTIYLYNTGSFGQWNTNNGEGTYNTDSTKTKPGQYLAIPKNSAGIGTIPYSIPSMSGFLAKATTTGVNGSITIIYRSTVIAPNVSQQRAPSKDSQTCDKVYMEISLKGENSGDKMWLFDQSGTTRRFDNGWDGTKIMGAAGTPQLFAMEESGNYQISTSDDINNTFLGFQAGNDVQDTLTFTNENIESKYTSVYLVDLVENKVTDITKSGTQYTFTAESTPQAIKRFKIVTRLDEKDAPDASTQIKVFNSGNTVFVQNLGDLNGVMFIYDMMGRTMKNTSFGPYGITAVQVGTITGAYVVKAATSNESVSKRVIIGKE